MAYEHNWKADELGAISLWKNDGRNSDSQPLIRGKVTMRNGTEMDVALWKTKSDNPRAPVMTGKLKEPWKKDANNGGHAGGSAQIPADYDDDIPF